MAGTGSTSDPHSTTPRIVTTENVLGGDPRIDGRQIGVYHVSQRYVEGDDTPEEIAASYDISIAEVHAALAYAFSHPETMRAIEARNRSVDEDQTANRIGPDDVA